MVQQFKDPALSLQQLQSLLWRGLDPWPRNMGAAKKKNLKTIMRYSFYLFIFWLLPCHKEVPRPGIYPHGPGILPVPQQQPEPQLQHWILTLLHHKRTLRYSFKIIKEFPLWLSG